MSRTVERGLGSTIILNMKETKECMSIKTFVHDFMPHYFKRPRNLGLYSLSVYYDGTK